MRGRHPLHMRSWRALIFVALAGCVVDTHVDPGTRVSCVLPTDCPDGWQCLLPLGECYEEGTAVELPALEVAFAVPSEAAHNVSITERLLVVFSADVAPESRVGRVRLASASGARELVAEATDFGNTFAFSVGTLDELTAYSFSVDAGVEPRAATHVTMASPFVRRFTTGIAPDVLPPAPVTNITATGVRQLRRCSRGANQPTPTSLAS